MSDLFDFSYNADPASGAFDVPQTPILTRALDAYLTEQYGESVVVGGHIAFTKEGVLVDVLVNVYGEIDGEPTFPHGNGGECWDHFVGWIRGQGQTNTMTFYRRPHGFGDAVPQDPDQELVTAVSGLASEAGLTYHGHLITDGTHHGLLMVSSAPEAAASQAAYGQAALDHYKAHHDADPVVIAAMEAGIRRYTEGVPFTPGEETIVVDALRRLEAKLAQGLSRHESPFDLPEINPRPDVPHAFYN